MSLKPGPKPVAPSTGELDQRRRDNKDTPGNTDKLKPSKFTGKKTESLVFALKQSISTLTKAVIQKPHGAF